jgi:hypothetical protein
MWHIMKRIGANSKLRSRRMAGQGILEFILMAIIILGIVIGGMLITLTDFRNYFAGPNAPFKLYLECLLQSGAMPTLGGTTECELTTFQPTAVNMKPPSNPGNPGGGGGGGPRPPSSGGGGGGADGGRRGTVVQAGSGVGNLGQNSGRRRFRSEGVGGRKRSAYTGETGPTMNFGSGGQRTRFKVNKDDMNRNFSYEDDSARSNDDSNRSVGGRAPVRREEVGDQKRKTFFKQREVARSVAAQDTGDMSLSFGDFLRYLIIAAIIIALVLFIGGQLLQASKGMDN